MARRDVIALDRYRRERAQRQEAKGILVALVRRHGKDEVATWSTCETCQLPIHPAAAANPHGEPFKTHPGCPEVSVDRKAA